MGRGTGAKALFCFAEALASMLAGEKENMPGTPLALEEGRVGEVHGPSEVERKETLVKWVAILIFMKPQRP